MELKDCYKILGVDADSSIEYVNNKWMELVKQLHTDHYQELPPEAKKTLEDRLKDINAAHDFLNDVKKHEEQYNSCDYSSLVESSRLYLYSLLQGNEIRPEDFKVEGLRNSNYKLHIKFSYNFKPYYDSRKEAGGEAADETYESKSAFESRKDSYRLYANDARDEKKDFLNNLLDDIIEVFSGNKKYNVWESPTASYSYDCRNCRGSGKVTCHVCHGRGYVTEKKEIHGAGGVRTEFHDEKCYKCRGSGREECSTCNGHGFFTEYYKCILDAEPIRSLSIDEDLHFQDVLNFIGSKTNEKITNIARPELVGHGWSGDNQYLFNLDSSLCVVEEKITVKKNNYTEVLVNNIPGILLPPIFNDVFSEVSKNLQSSLAGRFLNIFSIHKDKVLGSFEFVKSYRTIDFILKEYKNTKDKSSKNKKQYMTSLIKNKTGNYISNDFSEGLAGNLVEAMKSISPYSTPLVWLFAIIISLLLEIFVIVDNKFEGFHFQGSNAVAIFFVTPFLFSIIIIPVAIMINNIVTRKRQRHIPEQYRSKIYNRKSILISIIVIFVSWFAITYFMMFL